MDPRKLVATAADAMLKSLDPYSEFEATQEQVRSSRARRRNASVLKADASPLGLCVQTNATSC